MRSTSPFRTDLIDGFYVVLFVYLRPEPDIAIRKDHSLFSPNSSYFTFFFFQLTDLGKGISFHDDAA